MEYDFSQLIARNACPEWPRSVFLFSGFAEWVIQFTSPRFLNWNRSDWQVETRGARNLALTEHLEFDDGSFSAFPMAALCEKVAGQRQQMGNKMARPTRCIWEDGMAGGHDFNLPELQSGAM
uniref:HDC11204 n=1 Tax=Drosophila melanogaster TaxID=7227 RepID=Q6IKX3_DROME|nr:TPA_inf: HDC11204 [Drosophila melanogaster]